MIGCEELDLEVRQERGVRLDLEDEGLEARGEAGGVARKRREADVLGTHAEVIAARDLQGRAKVAVPREGLVEGRTRAEVLDTARRCQVNHRIRI